MRPTERFCSLAAVLGLATLTTTAWADGRDYNDGPVVNVASIRTLDGHFDDYMRYLATTYRQEQEAAKKAGLILGYRIMVVEARTPQDPDILLITEYKDWAALDHLAGKIDHINAQVEGSVDKSNQGVVDRNKIRTILGSRTMQEALLK